MATRDFNFNRIICMNTSQKSIGDGANKGIMMLPNSQDFLLSQVSSPCIDNEFKHNPGAVAPGLCFRGYASSSDFFLWKAVMVTIAPQLTVIRATHREMPVSPVSGGGST